MQQVDISANHPVVLLLVHRECHT
ncbi:hypothetical protein IEO21_04469 [Rhodonia placenta]|uniref:Uncharacterized protein n=1 Tax=Rhodonia placenta TaxID=104341 RepID=A0A8H7P471_9APHY|nr:hypothetical protein IEO21_04469 [Postia placenta]